MAYSIHKLAKMSGVSTRTLRYYHEIGLLKPMRVEPNGYRIYGENQVDTLQQILFLRELEFPLEDIKKLLTAPGFDKQQAFESHLAALHHKRARLDTLIGNVLKSIAAMKGEIAMTDHEKFEGFKQKLVDDNEQQYGREIRGKYGDEAVDESNATLKGLTKAQYDEGERLRFAFEEALKAAFDGGDPAGCNSAGCNPAGQLAQKACDLHRQWLWVFYPKYSKAYHKGLADMYVSDERFKANYEKLGKGCTEFLRDAIYIYCQG